MVLLPMIDMIKHFFKISNNSYSEGKLLVAQYILKVKIK